MPVTACWWIIGRDTDRPAVAVDLYDGNLGKFMQETWTCRIGDRSAHVIVEEYAAKCGIDENHIIYDSDSTKFYAKD